MTHVIQDSVAQQSPHPIGSTRFPVQASSRRHTKIRLSPHFYSTNHHDHKAQRTPYPLKKILEMSGGFSSQPAMVFHVCRSRTIGFHFYNSPLNGLSNTDGMRAATFLATRGKRIKSERISKLP
jgi:hypothetical protein